MLSNRLPSNIVIIAAITRDRALGADGKLLYHLSEDMRRFKMLTLGNPVIMGRRTFESIGRPLPGRLNIVLSRNPDFAPVGVTVAPDLERALVIAGPKATPYILGGGQVYAQAMRYATRIELTHILADGPAQVDARFPELDPACWQQVNRTNLYKDEKSGVNYLYASYSRKIPNFAVDD